MTPLAQPTALTWTIDDALAVSDGFNCGPAALCAVTGLTPAQALPHLEGFEQKHYTNPSMMFGALASLGVRFDVLMRTQRELPARWPRFGLVRIQWAGPWTRVGVPMAARYRHTHWVAAFGERGADEPKAVFDVNAMHWTHYEAWRDKVVPWLLAECEPKATGAWWVTHSIDLLGAAR